MRQLTSLLIGLLFLSTGCARPRQENAITIMNVSAVDEELLERLRAFAEKELHVPIRTVEKPRLAGAESVEALKQSVLRLKADADVSLIVLAGIDGDEKHLSIFADDAVALINTQPLTAADPETYACRLQRMVMRAAAFNFGLPPTPDPFCVTRDYRSLDDLDRMGRNYSPPWMARFAEEAARRGLQPLPADGQRMPK